MKKFILFIFAALLVCSCGNSSNKASEDDYNKASEDDYKVACENGDFVKAYSIVKDMKEKMQNYENENAEDIRRGEKGWSFGQQELATYTNLKNNYEEAKKYVVLQEAISILENQGISGLPKITFIAKEHDAESWLYLELCDIAESMGDEELVKRLQKIHSNPHRKVDEYDVDECEEVE